MPNIRDYTNPITGLQPDERGTDAALQVARRGGAFFNQAADAVRTVGNETARMADSSIRAAGGVAVDYMQHKEISQGAAGYAGLNDALTQKWNDIAKTADPNDPTVAAKFRQDQLEPALQKFGESFLTEGGQKWAEARVESLRTHMFEKTAADMGTLAANAVSVNVRQTANSLSNTAMTDPSSVPHLLDGIDHTIGAMVDSSPNLKGADAAKARLALTEKMREDIVKSGAIGAIQKAADPEAEAKRWGEKYPEYINGADLKTLSSNARQQLRADRMDRAYSDMLSKKDVEAKSDATETGYLQKLYSDDPKLQAQVSAKAIVNDPSLTRTAKERMVNVVNREMKPETDSKISAQTSIEILRQMRDPNADPQKVSDAIFEARTKDPGTPGSLTKSDMTDLQKQLVDLKTPQGAALASDRNEFFKRYAPTIDPSMGDISSMQFGHHSALGMQKMYEAEKAARRMEEDVRKRGQDPHTVYDPSSPNFFGKPANILKYRASLQESVAFQKGMQEAKPTEGEKPFTPPASWQFSASRQQYRDPATGAMFDSNGKPVK